jgi:hypothetical protein
MGLTGVPLQIQKQLDNLAAYRAALTQAVTGRTLLWQMVQNADNPTYENRVFGGYTISQVDTALDSVTISQGVAPWFAQHNSYFQNDLAITGVGFVSPLDAWLAGQRWRVSQYLNRVQKDVSGSYLTATNVFPRDDLALGSHAKTSDVFTAGSPVDQTQSGLGRVMAVVPQGTTIGGTNYTVTATLTRATGAGLSLAVTFSSGAIAGAAITYGSQALSGTAASGQAVVPVAATAQFLVGEYVLLSDSTGFSEWGQITSLVTNTSITLTTNLVNTYTTGNTAKVAPLFAGVTAATCSGTGTSGDNIVFKVNPDRVVALNGSA